MSVVAECLSRLTLGETQTYHNLVMIPLISEGNVEPQYQLLDEALKQRCARVTEVSESGSVPELKFANESDRSVLLLDGEELVGAKQNRILNLTILAPALKTIVIPVSCVEAGRWRQESTEFASFKRAHYASGRARKSAQVSASLRESESRHSDQSDIWANISSKAARMNASSGTSAAAAMYEKHRARLDEYISAFSPIKGQVGAVFSVNEHVIGLDLFDSADTFAKMSDTLVESYALDALDTQESNEAVAGTGDPQSLMDDASKAEIESFPAIGEGEDLRVGGKHLTGGALVKDNTVVHLCVFRIQEVADAKDERLNRLARASLRRRHWSNRESYD
jgi:hypothetical protein